MAHSSTMHSIDEYILRSQYTGGQGPVNSHTYYRFQPHSGTMPLLQEHSHGLQLTGGNTNASDSLALTEMSLVNSGQMEAANSYYSASNPTYPPDPSAILHHSQHPPSDLMTNAFTYNVNTSSASTGLYPISTDLVAIANSNSNQHQHQNHQHPHQHQHQHQNHQQQHQRTYTEIGQCNPGASDLAHHVTTLGPMVSHCLDSLSSSTSDKTAEVDDEWHLPKHHTMMLTRNGPLPHSQPSQQPYMTYVRSNEVS